MDGSRKLWGMFQSELNDETCESIIDSAKECPEEEGTTFSNADNYRKSQIRWIKDDLLSGHLMKYVESVNSAFFGFDLFNGVNEIQYTEYSAEDNGFFKPHHDVLWTSEKMCDRKISMTVQLSDPDEYEGGEFVFNEAPNPDADELKKKGTILVFPSFLLHEVTPVTKGLRKSLVMFVYGPRWR